MHPFRFGYALFALLAFVAVVPVWTYWSLEAPQLSGLPTEMRFLITLTLPAVLLLFLGGWASPG